MRTLVLGGYGNFGARICRALAGGEGIALLVGGRDAQRAEAFARTLGGDARGVRIDVQAEGLAQSLRGLRVELVIHTAGPFQGQAWRVAQAVAQAGAHYIDLADGRRFVCDFAAALNPAFRAAGRTAISGASTVPALSSAVVDHLTAGWTRIHRIDTCIAPAQGAPGGEATLAAVLGYCGAPIPVWQAGQWVDHPGWASPETVRFARMRPRRGALCDIPDLELFPQRYPGVQTVMFRAALDAFGSALGGMVVRVEGVDAQGAETRRAWHIAADHNHGPEIPCMAAILLARRRARGEALASGAHACAGWLTLTEFEPAFARWGMLTDVVDGQPGAGAQLHLVHRRQVADPDQPAASRGVDR